MKNKKIICLIVTLIIIFIAMLNVHANTYLPLAGRLIVIDAGHGGN